MTVFQKYLEAVRKTGAPKQNGVDDLIYAKMQLAYAAMLDDVYSSSDAAYLHESSLGRDRKILLVISPLRGKWLPDSVLSRLAALAYLERLNELEVNLMDHLSVVDRVKLKFSVSFQTESISLRNQTSNSIVAFAELSEALTQFSGVHSIDMYSRLTAGCIIDLADEIVALLKPAAVYSTACDEIASLVQEIDSELFTGQKLKDKEE